METYQKLGIVVILICLSGCGQLANRDGELNPYKQGVIEMLAPDGLTIARTADDNNNWTGNFTALSWDLE